MLVSLVLGAAAAAAAYPTNSDSAVSVDRAVPDHAAEPVLQPFVSFSIEFAWFPDFAGMSDHR